MTHDEDGAHENPAAGGRLREPRALMAMALVVLLLLATGAAVWGYLGLREADARLDARTDAARTAERFAVQFNTYGPEDVEGYTESLDGLLSTSAQTAFERQLEDITSLIRQTEMESQGEVLASGVAELDDDSATVLVVADAQVQSEGGRVQRHFRWEVSLVKVDGRWLVDDFSPVA